ncbi:hypothetical protein CA12_15520 [Alienimonas californiensis]|uniref:Uncharacterized protein n=2 Tax=Alienimonas californiensis TaxID=2527989 RepID=A0A517P7W8_9PLAN|nr:hypothetical protein CA12_15520 [Alienimonas californiensis]
MIGCEPEATTVNTGEEYDEAAEEAAGMAEE